MRPHGKQAEVPRLAQLRWQLWLWWLLANIAGYPVAGALFGIWQWRGLRRDLARGLWWCLVGIVGLVALATGKKAPSEEPHPA